MAEKTSVLSSNPADVINIFWISDIGMDSDVDIGTLPMGSARQIYGSILLQTALKKSTQAQIQFMGKLIF